MNKRSPWAWVPTLYFAEGVPYVAVMTISVIIYKRLGLSNTDINSVIAMFYRENDESAYAVLGISPNATDDEVKSAYRRMAMKNHPDKVATLGPEVQKAAEEKFRQIQDAYETIKRQRGMS